GLRPIFRTGISLSWGGAPPGGMKMVARYERITTSGLFSGQVGVRWGWEWPSTGPHAASTGIGLDIAWKGDATVYGPPHTHTPPSASADTSEPVATSRPRAVTGAGWVPRV